MMTEPAGNRAQAAGGQRRRPRSGWPRPTRRTRRPSRRPRPRRKQVIEEARADAERIAEQLQAQADAEVERIKVQGAQQVQLLRAQLIRQLRQDLGAESVQPRRRHWCATTSSDPDAAVGHGRPVPRRARRDGAVEAVIADPATAQAARGQPRVAGGTWSRAVRRGGGGPRRRRSCPRWPMIWPRSAKLLTRESVLTRHLADPADDPRPRCGCRATARRQGRRRRARRAEGRSVGTLVVQCATWSTPSNTSRGWRCWYAPSASGQVDDVEEQLFRFSRILDSAAAAGHPAERLHARRPRAGSSCCTMCFDTRRRSQRPPTASCFRRRSSCCAASAPTTRCSSLAEARGGPPWRGRRARQRRRRPQRRAAHPADRGAQPHLRPPGVACSCRSTRSCSAACTIAVGDEVIDGTLSSQLAAAETQLARLTTD